MKTPFEKGVLQGLETLAIFLLVAFALYLFRDPLLELLFRITRNETVFLAILAVVPGLLTAGGQTLMKWLRDRQGGIPDYVNK